MTQHESEREEKRDRIATVVYRAMDDLISREDPHFYDGTGPGGEVSAALVIGTIRRRSDDGVVIEAMGHGFDRSELPAVWKEVKELASKALAKLRLEGVMPSVSRPIQ